MDGTAVKRIRSVIFNPVFMLAAGALLGAASRYFDMHTQVLGDIFSETAVWILLGTAISLYSPTARRAAVNVFLLCAGMLAAYYAVAEATNGVYGTRFIAGWSAVAALSPLLSLAVRRTRSRDAAARLLAAGVVAVSVGSTLLLFGGLHLYDIIINAALVWLLFFAGNGRKTAKKEEGK